jgi:hypothetical protein
MTREADYYAVDETARVLGMSPARVRQTLRSGELEGERREERIEGVLGPWRIPARAVRAFQERLKAGDDDATVALSPSEETTADTLSGTPEPTCGEVTTGTPSEASEKLSEEVRELREMAKALLGEIDRVEGRLEATEVEQFALGKPCGGRRSGPRSCGPSWRPRGVGSGRDPTVGRSETDSSQAGLPYRRLR